MHNIIPAKVIESKIFLIRGHKVMLDIDLAALYGVRTKRLNEQVRRNRKRFPADFMFQLDGHEARMMRTHSATAYKRNIRFRPYVFTEHGVAMLSSVLNSDRAVQVNIAIMRAFIKLRETLAANRIVTDKLREIERKLNRHDSKFKNQSSHIRVIFKIMRDLLETSDHPRKQIGFKPL